MYKDNQEIYYDELEVKKFESCVFPRENHRFPFKLQLPSNLEPTLIYKRSSKSMHFRVKYKLRAKIENYTQDYVKEHPMIAKRSIIISRPSSNPQRNINVEVYGKVKNLFLTTGTCKFNAIFDKKRYNVEEHAMIECNIDNSISPKKIESITIALKRTLKGRVK